MNAAERILRVAAGNPESAAKAELRRQLIAARKARPSTRRADDARRLAEVGLGALPAGASTVAAYAAVGTEPDSRPLIDALRSRGLRVLLPVLLPDGDLDWAPYPGWASLVPGPHGLLEPPGPGLGPDAVQDAVLVLVPGLAVDRRGRRLGRGGGSYDRVLARIPRARSLVVVYDEEVLDEVPVLPHDRPVGGALTPSRILKF